MFLVSACSCLCAIYWSQVLSGEWRCSWSSAGDAPTISEWPTNWLPTKVSFILKTWQYSDMYFVDCSSSQWRHDERDGVSNRRRPDCLLNRLFRRRSRKTWKLRVTDLCEGNPLVSDGFPHKRTVTRKTFLFDGDIMSKHFLVTNTTSFDYAGKK